MSKYWWLCLLIIIYDIGLYFLRPDFCGKYMFYVTKVEMHDLLLDQISSILAALSLGHNLSKTIQFSTITSKA